MKIDKKELMEKYLPEIKKEIKNLVAISSYKRGPKGSPVDKEVEQALDYALNLAKSFGFKTFKAKDARYGYADFGDKPELFGILCHLDVVPPGDLNEWNSSPFEVIEKDGKLIGRGVFDDKGPTIINLYAVKCLIDHGFEFDYTIRFIFGTSEETTWECMEAYVKNERLVDRGYVPDGNFPVVYAEKYIADMDIVSQEKADFELKGGEIYNVVCDLVSFVGPQLNKLQEFINNDKKNNLKTYIKDGKLFVKGKSSHGSLPQYGICASTYTCWALTQIGVKHQLVNFIANNFWGNNELKQFFGETQDETGTLTWCNGIINIDSQSSRFTLNFRIPCVKNTTDTIVEPMKKILTKEGFEFKLIKTENRIYQPIDGEIVTKIMDVYKEVTGDQNAKPIAIGGGTFAKSMPNLLAFGAEFDNTNSTMHTPNEFLPLSDLEKMFEIYVKSLIKLTKKD
ncbi:Sapep family Mn(2+)-dependent dipeptidase [Spiroplasma endosymbiont of Crioceris asparagi]|uniref:Sapep family Mn(2+)-dependent dipeptidase n=1 Tax=Spiroplasma endosymbiont of Crioceris asparagi TaxID=3066286 RepID=UPI0030D2818B